MLCSWLATKQRLFSLFLKELFAFKFNFSKSEKRLIVLSKKIIFTKKKKHRKICMDKNSIKASLDKCTLAKFF